MGLSWLKMFGVEMRVVLVYFMYFCVPSLGRSEITDPSQGEMMLFSILIIFFFCIFSKF